MWDRKLIKYSTLTLSQYNIYKVQWLCQIQYFHNIFEKQKQLIFTNGFGGIALQVVLPNSQDIVLASGFYHFVIQFLSDNWEFRVYQDNFTIIIRNAMSCHDSERFNVT